ncbi:MAG: hypothetical protein WC677_02570 [Clostridia bacterium]|jgi:hypothetical protein
MKKSDFLITKDGKRIFQIVGRWGKDYVFADMDENSEEVLIYTPTEVAQFIEDGDFRILYKVADGKEDNNG